MSLPHCPCAHAALCRPLHDAAPVVKGMHAFAVPTGNKVDIRGHQGIDVLNTDFYNFSAASVFTYAFGHPLRFYDNGTVYNFTEHTADSFPDWRLICGAHAAGKRVMATLNGGSHYGNATSLEDPAVQKRLIPGIVAFLDRYGLDGVEIDVEGVYKHGLHPDQPRYVAFLHAMKSALSAANPSAWLTATMCCNEATPFLRTHGRAFAQPLDGVLLMCYSWSTYGPEAPLDGVRAGVTDIAKEIGADKLIVSAPWRARAYACCDPQACNASAVQGHGEYVPAYYYQVVAALGNCTVRWDARSGTPEAACPPGALRVRGLNASCPSKVYYEDGHSLSLKYAVADEVGGLGHGAYVIDSLGNLSDTAAAAFWTALGNGTNDHASHYRESTRQSRRRR